jgi:hypothetical protein
MAIRRRSIGRDWPAGLTQSTFTVGPVPAGMAPGRDQLGSPSTVIGLLGKGVDVEDAELAPPKPFPLRSPA